MSTSSRPLPPKKDVALALLQGPSLFIHLDPRRPEVLVPAYFKKQPQLVLQVGMNMAIAIPDLKVDDDGVSCTLSFNRRPFWCRLPWSAVYALVGEDMKGMIWPDEVPSEVAAQRESKGQGQEPATGGAVKPRSRAPRERKKLAVAPSESSPPEDSNEPAEVTPPSSPPADAGVSAASAAPPPAPRPMAPLSSHAGTASSLKRPDSGKPVKRELPPYLRIVK